MSSFACDPEFSTPTFHEARGGINVLVGVVGLVDAVIF